MSLRKEKLVMATAALLIITCSSIGLATDQEITLSDDSDRILNDYCIDLIGGIKDVDVAKGLQAHTSYRYQSEPVPGLIFEPDRFDHNQFYMSEFDGCATLSCFDAGATAGLYASGGSELQ